VEDRFFSQTHCDRCTNELIARIMSWFNDDTICMECLKKEKRIKDALIKQGKKPSDYEGCGYIPKLS